MSLIMFFHLIVSAVVISSALALNFGKNTVAKCPTTCICRKQHLTETSTYRFMEYKRDEYLGAAIEYNDVLYEKNRNLNEHNVIVRSAMCILQIDTDPAVLINQLSETIEALTIIQGYNTVNKTIHFSDLKHLNELISIELLGPNPLSQLMIKNGRLLCHIDVLLPKLKYLNLENVHVKRTMQQRFNTDLDRQQYFEYVQRLNYNAHPLIITKDNIATEPILPYQQYKGTHQQDSEQPLFMGLTVLYLLRIVQCELNTVHWAMFDGLHNLQYLILDRNNIKFIPPFAFYGTPNLHSLSLAQNNLLDIQIMNLAGLLELQHLDLSGNSFTQLSELSLPPLPKLKLANFAYNPITVIFPNTFEVLNTTDSLILGNDAVPLALMANSFAGLIRLNALTIYNVLLKTLQREYFAGMEQLQELTITGNITALVYDTFVTVDTLRILRLKNCRLRNISMDAFYSLEKLEYLDLSQNQLEILPPGLFDQLRSLRELYLNDNRFWQLPSAIFRRLTHLKLLRLTGNQWWCTCAMSDWKPMIVNRIKRKMLNNDCRDQNNDKGVNGCQQSNEYFTYSYVYDKKMAPKCAQPIHYQNWSVFHAMRRLLKCDEYRPKLRQIQTKWNGSSDNSVTSNEEISTVSKPIVEDNSVVVTSSQVIYHDDDNQMNNNAMAQTTLHGTDESHININSIIHHLPFDHQRYIDKMKKYRKKLNSNSA